MLARCSANVSAFFLFDHAQHNHFSYWEIAGVSVGLFSFISIMSGPLVTGYLYMFGKFHVFLLLL